jgi:hypothetical protein
MLAMTLKRYRRPPGRLAWDHVLAGAVNRALADLEGIASLPQVAGPTQMIAGVPVPSAPPTRDRFLWLKVTGPVVPSAEPYYPDWVEQTDNGDGSFSDAPDGLTGSAQLLAFEVGDREAPVGAVVPAWVSGDDPQSVTFEYSPPPEPLTVREVVGTSVSPVTVIEFDQSTGARITDRTGGVARYENVDASETQTGVINTTDQTLLGWKDFKTGVLVGRLNGGAALTAEIHFNAFPGSDAREQSRVRVVEDVNHPGGDYQTMILTAGFGSFNYGAEKSAELWVDGESQCFRLYAWTGSSLAHKRPDLFLFNDGGLEVQGQTVTDSGVTYTSGLRTGGTLALSLTGAVTGSLSGGSIATTYAGAVDGGTWV